MNEVFSELFRPLEKGMCRLSPKGIAVKTSSGYTAYDRRTGRLVSCDGAVFDLGENAFFAIPATRVREGDIIIDQGKPAYVKSVSKNEITALNFETGRVETLVPRRHIFMEQVYFYQKIVSLFGSGPCVTGKKGAGKIMRMMMLSQMLKGSDSGQGGPFSSLLPFFLLRSSGGEDLFEGLSEAFDEDDDDDEAEKTAEADSRTDKAAESCRKGDE